MPTKVNGAGGMQEYDATSGRYGSGDGDHNHYDGHRFTTGRFSRRFTSFRQDNAKRQQKDVDGKGETGYNESV